MFNCVHYVGNIIMSLREGSILIPKFESLFRNFVSRILNYLRMMRTSPTQFEVMVDYMERNGDLNKPTNCPRGRARTAQMWEELSRTLNLDTTGTIKPVEKWKKVWSDLKNNAKKKASKINQAARGTGGGPACKLVLSDLEQRVLAIMGTGAATGLPNVHESGLELVELYLPVDAPETPSTPVPGTPVPIDIQTEPSLLFTSTGAGTSTGGTSFITTTEHAPVSPTQHHAQVGTPTRARRLFETRSPPTLPEHPTSRRRSPRHTSPRRRSSTHRSTRRYRTTSEDAMQQFLGSEERWLEFSTRIANEFVRQRNTELQQQAQCQSLFAKCLEIMEKFVNK